MKRMFGTVLLGIFLLACAPELPDETTEQKPDVTEEETPPAPGGPPPQDGSGKSGCDLYGTVVGEVNGRSIPVPVECNPYYFDKGDPPPEKLKPGKQFVNES